MRKIEFLFALAFLFASCDKAPVPENNANDLAHDDFVHVELVFTPGTLEQDNIDNIYAQGFTPDASSSELTLNVVEDREARTRTITPAEGLTFVPSHWYKVEVRLYNLAGANVNHTISDFPHQVKAHQFYYRTMLNKVNQLDKYVDFRYGDLNSEGKLVMPPLGFVGYIKFKDDLPAGAQLNPILVHVVPPALKTHKRGESYPFHSPPASLLNSVDANFLFPIAVTHN